MSNQDKLIKQGIKYTDRLFDEISKRIEKGVRKSDTLEEFLVAYHKAFPEKGNPLVSLGYDKEMLDIILSETNNHKFSKPAQKELVRITVNDRVGDLIVDVGDDVKESVREIVRDGYDRNLSQDEIALNISNRVGVIKNKRARAIARTEIARTATISDYVINRERGAKGWYVECRNTACKVCKNAWHKGWTEETDDTFVPSEYTAGKKGWVGDRIFSMNDIGMLPPVHPNCRCVVYYTTEEPNVITEPFEKPVTTSSVNDVEPTQSIDPNDKRQLALALSPEELNAMDFQELSDYFGLTYRGVSKDLVTKQRRHLIVEKFEDGRTMGIWFDESAVESYLKKGIATPNEIIAEIMKVPLENRRETNSVHFHDNYRGILQSGKEIDANTLGYNCTLIMGMDYQHDILLNPRLFKGSKGRGANRWIPNDEDIVRWKKNLHHEFEHSGDETKKLFDSDEYMPLCWSDEYTKVHLKEKYFTEYANSERHESWAEHGGYISYMEANPHEQHRLITIQVFDEEKGFVDKKINYAQYKQEYPEHYNFFMKKHNGEMEFDVLK